MKEQTESSKTNPARDGKSGGPPENFESDGQLAEIVALARSVERIEAPPDLTRRVMEALPGLPAATAPNASPREPLHWSLLTRPVSEKEVALCFFLVGVFYLTLGLMLAFGFTGISGTEGIAAWLLLQPKFAVATALAFASMAVLLLRRGPKAVPAARLWTHVYILFTVFNGMRMQLDPESPFAIAGSLCFTAGALGLGIFLLLTVKNLTGCSAAAGKTCSS